MIVLYAGRRGCGKTTTMVKDAYKFSLRGWPVVTNMSSVSFANATMSNDEILGLIMDGDKHDMVLMIDEIQTFIDSRRAMRKQNVDFTYFIQQIRKRNVVILATTQYVRRVDIAFREHIDVVARPSFKPEYPVVVVSYVDRTALESLDTDVNSECLVVYDPTPVYGLFDTTEVITPI